jgi:uncharacterized protein YbaR (Trm112 family)
VAMDGRRAAAEGCPAEQASPLPPHGVSAGRPVPGQCLLPRSHVINPELLEILRCPMNPSQARLRLNNDRLVCEQCGLVFPIRDGFPVLIVEEAELPPGCSSLESLPCQRDRQAGDPAEKPSSPGR